MNNLKITVEDTTRSIIVRGQKEDLDVIDAVIKEIDVKTKQVLIEAFIVDVTSTFAKALGTELELCLKKEPLVKQVHQRLLQEQLEVCYNTWWN